MLPRWSPVSVLGFGDLKTISGPFDLYVLEGCPGSPLLFIRHIVCSVSQRSGYSAALFIFTTRWLGCLSLFPYDFATIGKEYSRHLRQCKWTVIEFLSGSRPLTNGYKRRLPWRFDRAFSKSDMIFRCQVCGAPMSINLRADDTFVEDEGWHAAAWRYEEILRSHEGEQILFLELDVGGHTPATISVYWELSDPFVRPPSF